MLCRRRLPRQVLQRTAGETAAPALPLSGDLLRGDEQEAIGGFPADSGSGTQDALWHISCVKNEEPEASGPIICGLALSTPAEVVHEVADMLTRYRRRIPGLWCCRRSACRSRWRHTLPIVVAVLSSMPQAPKPTAKSKPG
jgi:hypothetical protein